MPDKRRLGSLFVLYLATCQHRFRVTLPRSHDTDRCQLGFVRAQPFKFDAHHKRGHFDGRYRVRDGPEYDAACGGKCEADLS